MSAPHDDQCEAEWIEGAHANGPCGCADRFRAERVGTWTTPEPPPTPELAQFREQIQEQITEATRRLWRTGRIVLETEDLRTTLTLDAQGRVQVTVEATDRPSTGSPEPPYCPFANGPCTADCPDGGHRACVDGD